MEVTFYNTETKETICIEEIDHVKKIFKRAKVLMNEKQLTSISFRYLQEDVTINATVQAPQINPKEEETCQKEN